MGRLGNEKNASKLLDAEQIKLLSGSVKVLIKCKTGNSLFEN